MSLTDYLTPLMLIVAGLFLLTVGVFISDCPLSFVEDGCLPIADIRVMALMITSGVFIVGGIISLQLSEMTVLKKDK